MASYGLFPEMNPGQAWLLGPFIPERSPVCLGPSQADTGLANAGSPPPCSQLLPPFWERETTVERFCDGVWMFRQPMDLGAGDVGMRMTVVKLRDGTLWVRRPALPTDSTCTQLSQGATAATWPAKPHPGHVWAC